MNKDGENGIMLEIRVDILEL